MIIGFYLSFCLATAEITAMSCFTAEVQKTIAPYFGVEYDSSYQFGWVACVTALLCVKSSIASIFNRIPNVEAGNNMQVFVPNITATAVPYNQFDIPTATQNKYGHFSRSETYVFFEAMSKN